MCAWVISFGMTFFINTLCPAVSPRVYLREEFTHPLDGFGLRTLIGGLIHQDDSYGSFPSGHVGETLAVGLAAIRLGATPRFGKFVIFASVMVTIATLWLRYHYVADVVAAVAVALASVSIALYGVPPPPPQQQHPEALSSKELELVTVVSEPLAARLAIVLPPATSNVPPLLSRYPRSPVSPSV